MPADDRPRFHDDEDALPVSPDSAQQHPKLAVDIREPRPFHRTAEDGELLAKSDILESQLATSLEGREHELLRAIFVEFVGQLSHIIRTIEYWDIERRRYPAYEHVAVLVAENITSRFLNVLSLFSGSIPLICIQFSALKVNDHILLDFVKVLDQTELRVDEEEEEEEEEEGAKTPADRAFWESKRPQEIMVLVDTVGEMINEFCEKKHTLNYTQSHIGLSDGLRTRNFVVCYPRKGHLRLGVKLSDKDAFDDSLADAGVDFMKKRKRIWLNLSPAEFESVNDVVRRIIQQAVKDYQS